MKKMYDEIVEGPKGLIKPKKRIAVLLPDTSLDIMKIGDVVMIDDRLIAVAKACPGSASFTLDPDGEVKLNELIDTLPLKPTAAYAVEYSYCTDYPGWDGIVDERRAIGFRDKAHWRELDQESIIYQVRKDQMRIMMEYVKNNLL